MTVGTDGARDGCRSRLEETLGLVGTAIVLDAVLGHRAGPGPVGLSVRDV